jgi:hypothetical protein
MLANEKFRSADAKSLIRSLSSGKHFDDGLTSTGNHGKVL